jgi:hypothetical protein
MSIIHALGLDNATSSFYLFWSGIGGILERLLELLVIGLTIYYHHNCHVKGCWRPGRFSIAGGTLKVCHHHHPYYHDTDITQEHIEYAYRKQRGTNNDSSM